MAKKTLRLSGLIVCVFLLLSFQTQLRSDDDLHRVWAVKDCRIISLSGPPIEKGTIVIRNGMIEAVGPNISIPPDAEVIDGSTLTAYPGLIDGLGQYLLKLPEEKFDITKVYTGEFTDKDKGLTPELNAFDFIDLGKVSLEKYHTFGFTAAHVLPEKGVLAGQASFFSLSSSEKTKALLLKDTCLGIGFSPASFLVYPNSLMGVAALLRQTFQDASHYRRIQSLWKKEMKGMGRSEYDARLEVISDYVTGKKSIVFLCRNQHDIRRALSIADEFNLNYFICDLGSEASALIPELKRAKARVLCTVGFKVPATSIHSQLGREEREKAEKEIYPKNPVKLAEAGIPFVFSSLGTDAPKSFREGILQAIEAGLSQEKALEALTKNAAAFFGLDQALGTIEPGKIANLALAEGDILGKEAKVTHIFADGQKFEVKAAKAKEGEKPAVNITGKWELNVEGGIKLTVEFTQEEDSLSGRMTTPFGVFDFTGGTVSGKEIYFEMSLSIGGQELDLYFSATVEEDTMRGSVVQGTSGSAEFTGKRIP
ncbi:MAG: amidohydrolase family protein [Candidatus Aminicenantales bacterium]